MMHREIRYGVTPAELRLENDAEELTRITAAQLMMAQRILGETGPSYSERVIALANVMALNRLEHSIWPQLCSIAESIEGVTQELGWLREDLKRRSPPT